jgi:hypothetical protein
MHEVLNGLIAVVLVLISVRAWPLARKAMIAWRSPELPARRVGVQP